MSKNRTQQQREAISHVDERVAQGVHDIANAAYLMGHRPGDVKPAAMSGDRATLGALQACADTLQMGVAAITSARTRAQNMLGLEFAEWDLPRPGEVADDVAWAEDELASLARQGILALTAFHGWLRSAKGALRAASQLDELHAGCRAVRTILDVHVARGGVGLRERGDRLRDLAEVLAPESVEHVVTEGQLRRTQGDFDPDMA